MITTAPKTYWTILDCLLYNKKIPAIPPLFDDGSFISGYCKKASLFNNFFFLHTCKSIKNNSALPPPLYKTNTRIISFWVTNKDVLRIIKSYYMDMIIYRYDKNLLWVSYYTLKNYIWEIIKKSNISRNMEKS